MVARILVVDDNQANLDLMLYLLRAFGHECTSATDGASGLENAQSAACDLALVDILMPGMDGYDFARRFRANPALASIPLVAVTALAMPGDDERIRKAGFDGYISKPIDPERFVAHVESYLRKLTPSEESERPIVLAVDDRQTNLDLINASLAPFGYRVAEARSVHEALDLVRRARPAIVVCDLHMPHGSGFDLLVKMQEDATLREIPFVFLSSKEWDAGDRERGVALGARKLLVRPIEPKKLRDEIEACLRNGDDPRR